MKEVMGTVCHLLVHGSHKRAQPRVVSSIVINIKEILFEYLCTHVVYKLENCKDVINFTI